MVLGRVLISFFYPQLPNFPRTSHWRGCLFLHCMVLPLLSMIRCPLLFFSHWASSQHLQPHRLKCTRPPSPPLFPRVCSDSCILSRWCHPTISFSVSHFSTCHQFFPAFPVSQFFPSGGQNIGVSASASFLPVYSQGWFSLGLNGLISLLLKGLSRVVPSTSLKASVLWCLVFFMVNSHIHTWLQEKNNNRVLTSWAKWEPIAK